MSKFKEYVVIKGGVCVDAKTTKETPVGSIIKLSDGKAQSLVGKVELLKDVKAKRDSKDSEKVALANDKLASEVAELTSANDKLTSEVAELTSANDKLASEVAELTSANDKLTSEVAELTSANDKLASEVAELTAQLAELAESMSAKAK